MPDAVIAFVRGVAAHNNVHRLTDGLKAAVAARGHACVDFDTADASGAREFKALAVDGRVRLVVAMNVGLNTLVDSALWLRETPAFLYMLDHPYAVFPYCDQIIGQFESVHLSHTGESQARFADRLHPRFRTTHVLPHAADAMDDLVPWPDRDVAAVFAGNYGLAREPEAERADWQRYGEHRAAALEAITARVDDGAHETLEHAAIEILAGDENLSAGQVCAHMKIVDMYLRGRVRWRAVQGLAATPGAVICGGGWDRLAAASAGRATFAGAADASTVQGLMRRARIAVNLLPDYYDSHERMFDAAAHGCLLISTESAFLRDAFGAEAVHFLAEPEDLADAVAYYTAHPDEAQEKAERGRAAFLAAHTWDHRAADLLRIVGAVRGR